jgi:enamine deaminase RidA (YjgF/YER057c/UK114 family)
VILGIETSCDETAAALITHSGQILSNVISSQADLHARYGGVVPEVASRRHLELVAPVVQQAFDEAGATLDYVVRTRMFMTSPDLLEDVGRAHREAFGNAKPANTGVVTGLMDPRWLVEIEAEAVLPRR